MSAEQRARVSVATKVRMADPEVRQRIRDGMAKAAAADGDVQPFLKAMRAVWALAPLAAQKRFLAEIFAKDGDVKSP